MIISERCHVIGGIRDVMSVTSVDSGGIMVHVKLSTNNLKKIEISYFVINRNEYCKITVANFPGGSHVFMIALLRDEQYR